MLSIPLFALRRNLHFIFTSLTILKAQQLEEKLRILYEYYSAIKRSVNTVDALKHKQTVLIKAAAQKTDTEW